VKSVKSNNESSPKYIRIARQIQEDIASNYTLGDYLPSVRTLSRRFGVTVNTIRMALDILAKSGMVTTLPYRGTVVTSVDSNPLWDNQGVLNLKTRHSLTPRQPAQNNKDSKTVALVMPFTPTLMTLLARSVERDLRYYGYRLQLASSDYPQERGDISERARQHERFALESLSNDCLAGIIWWSESPKYNMDIIEKLQMGGAAVTLLGASTPGAICDSLEFDYYTAAASITKSFLDMENRNVLFWGLTNNATIPAIHSQKLYGFLHALSPNKYSASAYGETFRSPYSAMEITENELRSSLPNSLNKRIILSESSFDISLLDDVLNSMNLPIALLVSSSSITERLKAELEARGLNIPDDIMIVSFEEAYHFSTSRDHVYQIQPDYDIMGERAVQLLMTRILEPNGRLRQLYLPLQLICNHVGLLSAMPNIIYSHPE